MFFVIGDRQWRFGSRHRALADWAVLSLRFAEPENPAFNSIDRRDAQQRCESLF